MWHLVAEWKEFCGYQDVKMFETRYDADGTPALKMMCKGDYGQEPLATITVCLAPKRVPLKQGEFIIKTWSENASLTHELFKSGLFSDTGRREPTGYVLAEIWKMNREPGEVFNG